MKLEMQNYIEKIERKIRRKKYIDAKEIEEHLNRISFYQQERLIHLLVTIFTGISLLISLGFLLFKPSIFVFLLFLALFILFTCYLIHYYYLENSVQTLYKEYYKMREQKKNVLKKILKK